MIRFTNWAFRNKAGMKFLVPLILALGVFCYLILPRELMPTLDMPQVSVTVMAPGHDANSLLREAGEPIEKAVVSAKGQRNVYTTASDGYVQVDVQFDAKTSMKDAKQQVNDIVNGIKLPEGLSKPFVSQLDTSMIPVADVGVTFANGLTQESYDKTEKQIIPAIQKVAGVSSVLVYGKNESQVVIKADSEKLKKKGVPLQALTGVLQGKNIAVAEGETSLDGKSTSIQVVGEIKNWQEIENLKVTPNLAVKDLATVELKKNESSITRLDGKDSVILIVSKATNTNAVEVAKGVRDAIKTINADVGPDIKADVFYSTSDMITNSVDSMVQEILMGALFATIIIFAFLRSVRITLLTVVSIPLSLATTLLLLYASGITLNLLTLGGIAIAVGRLVDDSIVVVENIFRKFSEGGKTEDVIVSAAKEVATAITASTLTTVAVFLPIGIVSGSLQQLLLPFGLTVTYSLISSLLVALTVIPLMASGLLKKAALKEHKKQVRYTNFLQWNLNHKWLPILIAILAFAGTIGGYMAMPQGAIDQSDASTVLVTLNYKSDTPSATVKEGALNLEKFIRSQPEPNTVGLMLGSTAEDAKYGQIKPPTLAQYIVTMKTGANATEFIKKFESEKSQYKDADLSASAASMSFQPTSNIEIDVRGNQLADLKKAAADVKSIAEKIDGVQKITTNDKDLKPGYDIKVAPDSPITAQEVSMQVGMLLNKMPIGLLQLNGNDVPVMLDANASLSTQDDLKNIDILTKMGPKKLGDVATIEKTEMPASIFHVNGKEYLRVTVLTDPKKLSQVSQKLAIALQGQGGKKEIDLPKGVDLLIGGAQADMNGNMQDLGLTAAVSIALVYLIMVLTFKTLRAPLAILFSIPLASIGAILGLMLTRTPLDINGGIGMLMLVGIVVTNAIVLIDRVKQNEEKMSIRDAILDAAAIRLRPILMTATATVFAMLPLLFAKSQDGALVSKSLAVVVIGGLIVSTLLTLVIVPVIYELFHYRKSRQQRKDIKVNQDGLTIQN